MSQSIATSSQTVSMNQRLTTFAHALAFVGGFSLIFIIGWGGAVTLAGQFFGQYKDIIARLGGVIVIIFGLATLDILRIPWFYADTRAQLSGQHGPFAGSALMGVIFAAGWSPCIGATLGAILTLGLSQETAGQAMWLSSGYSIGLGIPFLLLALGLERASGWIGRMKRYQRWFKIASGVFILIIGVMLLTNTMNRIAIWAFQHGYFIDAFADYAAAPTYLTAILAGLLSFVSPCVLPLVPAYLSYLSGQAVSKG
jgi:cytochrome c-type biogenesis protein